MTQDNFNQSVEESVRRFLEGDDTPLNKAHYCLSSGQRMEQVGDCKAAINCYSMAFGLPPDTNDVWYFLHNNIGYCLNQLGQHDDAELYCRQAIQINPERHNAFKNLGIALEGLGQYQEAAHHYAQATVLQPMDTRSFEHLERLMDAHPELSGRLRSLNADLLDIYHQRGIIHYSAAEAKVTAAVYTQLGGILEHVRSSGGLPDTIDSLNAPAILRKVVESRGTNIDLTPDEQLVYAAMIKAGRMDGGVAQLSDPAKPSWHFFKRSGS